MEEPVDLRLYYSDRLNETGPYFSAHAPGRGAARRGLSGAPGTVAGRAARPAAVLARGDLAVAEGLEGLPLSADGTKAYFGLSGRNSTDDIQGDQLFRPGARQLPGIRPDAPGQRSGQSRKPVVALLGDLPLMGTQFNQYQPWHVLEAMYPVLRRARPRRQAGAHRRRPGADAPQPHNVDRPLYAIDQFVMRGGRVLAFIDPLAEVMAAGGGMNPMASPKAMRSRRSSRCSAWDHHSERSGDRRSHRSPARQRTWSGRQVVVDYLPGSSTAGISMPTT